MKFFQNSSLRTKLIIAALIPVIALLYYLQLNMRQELNNKKEAREVLVDVSEIQQISRVVHEVQKERALSITFASSQGTKGRDQITEQREATDLALTALEKVL